MTAPAPTEAVGFDGLPTATPPPAPDPTADLPSVIEVRDLGIRYSLAQRGIAHGGQIYEAQRELRFASDDTLAQVIQGLAYDGDSDGAISTDEARPLHYTIQAVR